MVLLFIYQFHSLDSEERARNVNAVFRFNKYIFIRYNDVCVHISIAVPNWTAHTHV